MTNMLLGLALFLPGALVASYLIFRLVTWVEQKQFAAAAHGASRKKERRKLKTA